MTANTFRLITALLALALLAGGCVVGRTRTTSTPREEPSAAIRNADVEAVRHENAQLRQQQQALQSRIEILQHSLTQNQEEQRRFRESMATNFDLLEQSVALTLAKSVTADMSASAAQGGATEGGAASGRAMAEQSAPILAPQAMAAAPRAAAPVAAAPRVAARQAAPQPAVQPSVQPAARPAAVVTPVAMQGAPAEREAVSDPDLLPPESPLLLTAHGDAKPLYEKGFALFARKDYDQAVIVFENFLKRFPDDIYSDNAQFWIAEAYMNMNRMGEAETAYREVLRNYEHRSTLEGYKTPDAIYRLGQAYQRRGDDRRTRYYFEVLAERFPDTSAGRKAQRELATIGINTAAR